MSDSSKVLLTPSQIADLAGVSRGAVTNWRKRPSSIPFPEPVPGSEAKPLYDQSEVIAWLAATKPEIQIRQDHGQAALTHALNALRGSVPAFEATELALALCCARKLSAEGDDSNWQRMRASDPFHIVEALREGADRAAAHDVRWHDVFAVVDEIGRWARARNAIEAISAVVRVVDAIAPEYLAEAADEVFRRVAAERGRAAGYGLGEHGLVGSRISTLLSNLAAPAKGLVYDPACGIGEALIQTWIKSAGKVETVGHEINEQALGIARMRSSLHGIDTKFALQDVLNSDPDPNLRADVVIAEPPFGLSWSQSQNIADPRWAFGIPPTNSSEFAWIQHAIAHLKPGGTAYVVTAVSSLFARHRSATIRAELLRSGWIEAVIVLPPKMLPHTGIQLALWVLRQADHPSGTVPVLLVDASNAVSPETLAASWLTLGEGCAVDGAPPYALVQTLDLLADDAQLDPRRWVQTPGSDPEDVAARVRDSQRALRSALAALSDHAAVPAIQGPNVTPRVLTVKELVQLGVASIQNGRAKIDDLSDEDVALLVKPSDVRDGLPLLAEAQTTERAIPTDEPGGRTHAGDVLVTTWNTVRAAVDEQGGRIVGNGVHRLSID
ncbi:MAG: hypothetical protein EKK51_27590, partial [Mycolicibacterium sp.]|uniref:N-6 DNA methylase n=1 Tax=Mycolicibacterium sp. TaxID=2320850 RepID=UPI000FB2674F